MNVSPTSCTLISGRAATRAEMGLIACATKITYKRGEVNETAF
jgi:hypothetical protein